MLVFLSKTVKKAFETLRRFWIAFFIGFGFAILCFLVINAAIEPFSTSEYCGGSCHEMSDLYLGWKVSSHYANPSGIVAECIDCHLPPRDKYFTHLATKFYVGAKDTYKHYFGGRYDIEKNRQKVLKEMPNARCRHCHLNLTAKPATPAVRIAHEVYSSPPDVNTPGCVSCHSQLHKRADK